MYINTNMSIRAFFRATWKLQLIVLVICTAGTVIYLNFLDNVIAMVALAWFTRQRDRACGRGQIEFVFGRADLQQTAVHGSIDQWITGGVQGSRYVRRQMRDTAIAHRILG